MSAVHPSSPCAGSGSASCTWRPRDEGSRECYCHFQIERIDSKERLRHIEHQVSAAEGGVLVEDFQSIGHSVADLSPRLKSRRGQAEDVTAAQAFLEWLLDDNFILQGLVRYRVGRTASPTARPRARRRVHRPDLLPVVFPGLIAEVEATLVPANEPPHHRHRLLPQRGVHLPPGAHRRHRDPRVVAGREAPGGHAAGGRFAKGAFTQKTGEIPLLKEKLSWLLANSGARPGAGSRR